METLLDEEKTLINDYYDIIKNLKEITEFPNLDYLYKDLFYLFMIKSYNKKENKKQLFVKNLVPLLSQEMIYDLNNNPDIRNNVNNDMDTNLLNEEYINCYKQNYNLKSFLSNINSQKNVIYTYSAYSDNNNKLSKVVKNDFNGQLKIQFKNIKIININEETIKDFIIEGTTKRKIDDRKVISFLDGNFDLCIIKINEEIIRNNKINTDIRNLIFEMDKYFPKKDKILLYIIYIKKNIEHINNRYNNENNILEVFLLYNQIFIDNLYNKYEKDEKINIFCDNFIKGGESVINSELIDNIWERVFENINIKIKEKNYNYEYIEDIKKHLKENEYVSRQIKTKVNNLISKKILNISEVLRDKKPNDDFIKSLFSKNYNIICEQFVNIINYLEDELSLSIILFSNISSKEERTKLQNDFKNILDKFDEQKNYNGIKYIYLGFKLLGIFKDYKEINNKLAADKNFNIREKILLNREHQISEKLNKGSDDEKKNLFTDYLLYFISLIIELKTQEDKKNKILIFINKILIINHPEFDSSNLNNNSYSDFIMEKKYLKLDCELEKMIKFLDKNKRLLSKILNILNDFLDVIPNFNEVFEGYFSEQKIKQKEKINSYQLIKIYETFLACIYGKNTFSFYFDKNKRNIYLNFLLKNQDDFKCIPALISKDNIINNISILNIEIFLFIIKNGNQDEEILKKIINYFQEENEINFEQQKEFIMNNFDDNVFINLLMRHYKKKRGKC